MAIRKMKIDKKTFNSKFLPLYDDKNRFKVVYGGSGSGKSEACFRLLVIHIISRRNMNVLVLRKHQTSARKSVFPLLVKIINEYGLQNIFDIKDTRMEIVNKMNGNTIICTGLDDEEKIKSITFKNGILTTVMMEEANEFVENDFKQLNLRLRGKSESPFELYVLFNPIINKNHWIYRIFFDNKKANSMVLHSTCDDNKYVDEAYKEELRELAKIDPIFHKVYYLGEFANLDSLSNWIKNNELLDIFSNDIPDDINEVSLSCDVSRFGDDLSTVFIMLNNHILKPITFSKLKTTELAREIIKIINKYKRLYPQAYFKANVDGTGIGGGVCDVLTDEYTYDDIEINEINFSGKKGKKFKNLISELWWNIKQKIVNKKITMVNCEEVVNELVDRNCGFTDDGKFAIEDKSVWKKRHEGKSPDYSDGICLLFWENKNFII